MLDKIIHFSIHNRLMVGILMLALVGWGIYSLNNLPIDAVPDITNNQVQVVTVSPTLSPQEVEQFITYPLELALANLQEVHEIRSISRYGLSVITIVFNDDMPLLQARQIVNEKLQVVKQEIPEAFGIPELMPVTTGLGEIFQYTLEVQPGYEKKYDATELRTIQDWIVKRQMSGIQGIVEVSSFGGYLKQYEVSPDPLLMKTYNIDLDEIFSALYKNNENTGGSYIQRGKNAFYIRAEGLMKNNEDIENTVIKVENGIPFYIKNVATVKIGYSPRFGAMTKDGKGETVGGITLMLKGANSSDVMKLIHKRVEAVQQSLPEGIELKPYLDRSHFVDNVMKTVGKNLLEGGLIVVFVLVLLLGNLRAGLIVASVIPLAMLFAIAMMRLTGVSANLMSLGAIDFGLIVDGAVIIIESILHNLHTNFKGNISKNDMNEEVKQTSFRMSRSAIFGQIIILIVYLPIMALVGIEGKMFRPMALTVSYAIVGALLLSITYVPMMASFTLSRKIHAEPTFADKIMTALRGVYSPILLKALRFPKTVISLSISLFIISLLLFNRMGAEFIPTLEEGDLAMQMTVRPGSSLNEVIAQSTKAEQILLNNFPEVNMVISKIGTGEVPTDPMAIEDADIMIILKPKNEWTSATDREELVSLMKHKLDDLPGVSFEFSQPIQLRFNELMTGSKADVSIKIYGENLDSLFVLANKAAQSIKNIDGASDIKVEQTEGLPQVVIKHNRSQIASYGLNVSDINTAVRTAMAGEKAGIIFENERRFDLVVRFSELYRNDLSKLDKIFVKAASGQQVPLSQLATIEIVDGPMLISRDNTKRRINIGVNVRNRDVKSLVEEIQQQLKKDLKLPAGYTIHYGGQFENLEAAINRLSIAVPISLALIFMLLYFTFGSALQAAMIFSAIPLSAIGGILALHFRGMPFSISAGIGFIALFGVAVLNGIVLINYFNMLKTKGINNVKERIMEGATSRLRPVLMTAAVASLGFLPMAISSSAGGEVQRPLATVVIGGLITATLLTLVVLPVIYLLLESRKFNKTNNGKAIAVVFLLFFSSNLFAQNKKAYLANTTLENAFEIAARNNLDLKNAALKTEESKSLKNTAIKLGVTDFNLQRGQINYSGIDNFYTVTQDIGNPFEQAAQYSYLKEQTNYYKAAYGISNKQLQADISNIYFEYLNIVEQINIYKAQQQLYNKGKYLAELRYKTGETSMLATIAIQQKANENQIHLNSLITDSTILIQQFNLLLFSDTVFVPLPAVVEVKNNLQPELNTQHPLLLLAASHKKMTEKQLQAAKMRLLPSLYGGYFNQALEGQKGNQGFIAGFSIPLWFIPEKAFIKSSKIAYEASLNNYNKSIAQFANETEKLNTRALNAKSKINFYETEALPNAQLIIKQAETLFQNGAINYLEFIQNIEAAFDIKQNYLTSQLEYQKIITTLKFFTE